MKYLKLICSAWEAHKIFVFGVPSGLFSLVQIDRWEKHAGYLGSGFLVVNVYLRLDCSSIIYLFIYF